MKPRRDRLVVQVHLCDGNVTFTISLLKVKSTKWRRRLKKSFFLRATCALLLLCCKVAIVLGIPSRVESVMGGVSNPQVGYRSPSLHCA